MRLTCPNCSAQYEVPDEVIPEEGRDVQCSNCEKTWFQAKYPDAAEAQPAAPVAEETPAEPDPIPETPPEPTPEVSAEPEPTPEAAPEPESEPEAPAHQPAATGSVDPAVAGILREEAARESELRAQEGGSLESQPDLALDTPPEPDPKPPVEDLRASETSADAGQGDALPDVEAINSSLRGDDAPAQSDASQPAPRKSGGFMRGLALIVIIGIVLLLVYSNARQISEAVPQADPVLQSYVSFVDQARVWLEAQTSGASQN